MDQSLASGLQDRVQGSSALVQLSPSGDDEASDVLEVGNHARPLDAVNIEFPRSSDWLVP